MLILANQQAYLLKGYLLANEAPEEIIAAINTIIDNTGSKTVSALPSVDVDEEVEKSMISENPSNSTPLEKKLRKQRAPMTKEQRQLVGERMRRLHAEGKMKRKNHPAKFSLDEELDAFPTKPRVDTDPYKLIHDHKEYVGERDDKTLVDEDWGDIKKMRNNGLPEIRIAKSYGVTEDYLARFSDRMGERERLQAGNG